MTLLVTCHDYADWASVTDDLCDIDECSWIGGEGRWTVQVKTADDSIRTQLEGDDRVASVEVV